MRKEGLEKFDTSQDISKARGQRKAANKLLTEIVQMVGRTWLRIGKETFY